MQEQRLKRLKDKANKLPLNPGVYIMRDSHKEIIYIGKAKALKNRVTQYFGSQEKHLPKVRKMVENVQDFDYILRSRRDRVRRSDERILELIECRLKNITIYRNTGRKYNLARYK